MGPAVLAFLMLTHASIQVGGEADVEPTFRVAQDIDEVQNRLRQWAWDVAPEAGFEPATKRLTAARSTTELLRSASSRMDDQAVNSPLRT